MTSRNFSTTVTKILHMSPLIQQKIYQNNLALINPPKENLQLYSK